MKNEKLFNETIDKLVKAYFEGDLKHNNCNKCAVGNIVGNGDWGDHFYTIPKVQDWGLREVLRKSETHVQLGGIEVSAPRIFIPKDYSMQELMDIEWAFETAPKEGDWEFNGLMAVVDVLEKIHECDSETTAATKQRFVKQPA